MPLENIAIHFHDTYGRWLSNSLAGLRAGVREYDATTGGFFFNDTATTEIYTLSLHDALPIRHWLKREGTCLLLAPHHDVGFTSDLKQQQIEYLHHGDALVPRQQRFGQYTRSLM